jgi:jumonji domain-containing protein 7
MLDDVGEIPFAAETFERKPDAINLWIGDERSTTSYHSDYYENLYTVITGVKIFNLRPPCDAGEMRVIECAPGVFERDVDTLRWRVKLKMDASRVAWSAVDIDPITHNPIFGVHDAHLRYLSGANRPPSIDVEVRAGETLYLPAMWYHRVSQRGLTVAVNAWYDMDFGDRFAYANFFKSQAARLASIDGTHTTTTQTPPRVRATRTKDAA